MNDCFYFQLEIIEFFSLEFIVQMWHRIENMLFSIAFGKKYCPR